MSEPVVLYHNPRCSKSRQALALLREHGVEPEIVEYLKAPLSADALRELLDALGTSARGLLRTGEAPYRELALAAPARTEEELIAAMAAHPIQCSVRWRGAGRARCSGARPNGSPPSSTPEPRPPPAPPSAPTC